MNGTEISASAYQIYLSKGARDGHDKEDWFEAERLLISLGERQSA